MKNVNQKLQNEEKLITLKTGPKPPRPSLLAEEKFSVAAITVLSSKNVISIFPLSLALLFALEESL